MPRRPEELSNINPEEINKAGLVKAIKDSVSEIMEDATISLLDTPALKDPKRRKVASVKSSDFSFDDIKNPEARRFNQAKRVIKTIGEVTKLSERALGVASITIPVITDADNEIIKSVSGKIQGPELSSTANALQKWIQRVDIANKSVASFQRNLYGKSMKDLHDQLPNLQLVLNRYNPDTKLKVDLNPFNRGKIIRTKELYGLTDEMEALLRLKPFKAALIHTHYWTTFLHYSYEMMKDAEEQMKDQENLFKSADQQLPSVEELQDDLIKQPELFTEIVRSVRTVKDAEGDIIRFELDTLETDLDNVDEKYAAEILENVLALTSSIRGAKQEYGQLPERFKEYRDRKFRALEYLQKYSSTFRGARHEYEILLMQYARFYNRYKLFLIAQDGIHTNLSALRFSLSWASLQLLEEQNLIIGQQSTETINSNLEILNDQVESFVKRFPLLQNFATNPEDL